MVRAHRSMNSYSEAGAELKFVEGKRVTAPQYLQPVKAAIGLARFEVESRLSMGLINSPMHGAKIRVASAIL